MDPYYHWLGCIVILCVGTIFLFYCLFLFLRYNHEHHVISFASGMMLLADISMVVNFLPRSAYNMYLGKLDSGAWCQWSAAWTIASFVALSGGAVLVAHITERTCSSILAKDTQRFDRKYCLLWTVACWALGAFVSSVFFATDQLGPFDGLYCCTKHNKTPETSIPILLGFLLSIALISSLYYKAVLNVEDHIIVQIDMSLMERQQEKLEEKRKESNDGLTVPVVENNYRSSRGDQTPHDPDLTTREREQEDSHREVSISQNHSLRISVSGNGHLTPLGAETPKDHPSPSTPPFVPFC